METGEPHPRPLCSAQEPLRTWRCFSLPLARLSPPRRGESDTACQGERPGRPCWRRAFAWEQVQQTSEAYNAAIADYVMNTVPSRDVKLLIALHHAKRAYQEARAAEVAARS